MKYEHVQMAAKAGLIALSLIAGAGAGHVTASRKVEEVKQANVGPQLPQQVIIKGPVEITFKGTVPVKVNGELLYPKK